MPWQLKINWILKREKGTRILAHKATLRDGGREWWIKQEVRSRGVGGASCVGVCMARIHRFVSVRLQIKQSNMQSEYVSRAAHNEDVHITEGIIGTIITQEHLVQYTMSKIECIILVWS